MSDTPPQRDERAARRPARPFARAIHSLRARLVGLFVLLALAVTVTFVGGTRAAFRDGWQDYVRPLVAHYVDLLAADIGTPPDVVRAQALTDRLPLRIRIDGPAVVWDSQPPGPRDRGDRWNGDDPAQRRHGPPRDADDSTWRPMRQLADGHRIRFSLADVSREDRPRLIGWATLAALLALTALAYATVRRLLRPLNDIRAGALRFGQGDFSRPIAPRRRDELGELAEQINRMAANLHGMLDAKRALLLAISHELRSPLTRARLNAELVAEGPARDALLHDLAEMRDLISDLLESERLATGHAALQTEPSDLNALVAETLAAQFAGRAIQTELATDLPALPLDRTRIRLLLRNLLDNACRHGGAAVAPPWVSTARDGAVVRLRVRDHGPGVPDAQLAQLAQAFSRTDSARQRATGGVGLGLYLARLVAQAHGGSLSMRNALPGLEVEVTLPVPGAPR